MRNSLMGPPRKMSHCTMSERSTTEQNLVPAISGLKIPSLISSKGSFLCTIPMTRTDRIAHTTTFATRAVEHWLETEIAQWDHHEESIHWPITLQADATTIARWVTCWESGSRNVVQRGMGSWWPSQTRVSRSGPSLYPETQLQITLG